MTYNIITKLIIILGISISFTISLLMKRFTDLKNQFWLINKLHILGYCRSLLFIWNSYAVKSSWVISASQFHWNTIVGMNTLIYYYRLSCIIYHRLKLVFPWFVTSFSGVLSVEQVFVLWDLIIGYDSLEILAGKYNIYL